MKAILLSLLLLLPLSAAEPADEQHRIDTWLDKKMETAFSNQSMVQALHEARDMWDGEMNATYKRLMKLLNPAEQKLLRESQRKWLAFRDADRKAIDDIVTSQQGTMWLLIGAESAMTRVKERANHLLSMEHSVTLGR